MATIGKNILSGPTGLVHLRARYYAPWQARFLTRDPWDGDPLQPMSYNPWLYVYANPINLTDPSGRTPQGTTGLPPCIPIVVQAGLACAPVTIPPAPLPFCLPIVVQAGLPCIPVPCWGGPGVGWTPETGGGGGTPGAGGGGGGGQLPPLPSLEEIPNPEGRTSAIERAIIEYEKIRQELYSTYGADYIDPQNGKLLDWVLAALIIRGELGNLSRADVPYLEAVEAVSNEYHAKPGGEPGIFNGSNIQCGGSCTLAEQIAWLSDVEAWYSGRVFNNRLFEISEWNIHMGIAQQATSASGFCHRSPCNSWMWGDVAKDDPQLVLDQTNEKVITYRGFSVVPGTQRRSSYPGKYFWFVYAAGPFWP